MFPECLRQIIHHIFRHIPAGEHNHFNRRGTDVPVLVRIGTRLDGITCIPGVFRFQVFHELIINIYQACAAGQSLGDGGSRSTAHDPRTVNGAVLEHIGSIGKGNVLRLDVIRKFQSRRGKMGIAFIIYRRSCRRYGKTLSFYISQSLNARLGSDHHLVRIHVKTGNHFQIFIRMIFETVRPVETLVHIAGNSDGHLRFAIGNHIQVGNSACGSLARCLHTGNVIVPHIGDCRPHRIQGA